MHITGLEEIIERMEEIIETLKARKRPDTEDERELHGLLYINGLAGQAMAEIFRSREECTIQ